MIPRFRAWHKKKKKMYEMGTHFLSFNWKGWNLISSDTGECLVSDKNGVLMQSAGLKDKNGKEEFQHDIVRFPTGNICIIEKWKAGLWLFTIEEFKLGKNGFPFQYLAHFHEGKWEEKSRIEIIGNIHENPELKIGVKK
jgi:uncharacterized phage protein (TIGR01671 family)